MKKKLKYKSAEHKRKALEAERFQEQLYKKWGKLSEKQLAYWKKPNAKGTPRICKYAGQLLEVALAKASSVQSRAKAQAEEDDREMNRIVFEAEMESERRAMASKWG